MREHLPEGTHIIRVDTSADKVVKVQDLVRDDDTPVAVFIKASVCDKKVRTVIVIINSFLIEGVRINLLKVMYLTYCVLKNHTKNRFFKVLKQINVTNIYYL